MGVFVVLSGGCGYFFKCRQFTHIIIKVIRIAFLWAVVSCKFATSSRRKLTFLPWTPTHVVDFKAEAQAAAPPLAWCEEGAILFCSMMSFDDTNDGIMCSVRQNQDNT
jgi:hypothetical protein